MGKYWNEWHFHQQIYGYLTIVPIKKKRSPTSPIIVLGDFLPWVSFGSGIWPSIDCLSSSPSKLKNHIKNVAIMNQLPTSRNKHMLSNKIGVISPITQNGKFIHTKKQSRGRCRFKQSWELEAIKNPLFNAIGYTLGIPYSRILAPPKNDPNLVLSSTAMAYTFTAHLKKTPVGVKSHVVKSPSNDASHMFFLNAPRHQRK